MSDEFGRTRTTDGEVAEPDAARFAGEPAGADEECRNGTEHRFDGNTDTFLPSVQNGAAEAGIFQVTQVSLFSAAADSLLAQPKAGATSPAAANTNDGANAANFPTAPDANNTNVGAVINAAPTNAAATNTAAANTVEPNAGVANTGATQEAQVQLSSLNASLAALRLAHDEITVVDRVAQLVKDFNPTAFTDIISQLQAPQAVAATNVAEPGVAARAAA